MCSAMDGAALPAPGCPIRRSAGQRLFSASPRLIAAVHVLLRLLVPRHPPCALSILTVSSAAPEGAVGAIRRRARSAVGAKYPFGLCAVFKLRRGRRAEDFRPGPSKLSSSRGAATGFEPAATAATSGRHSGLLPRKEVIQPQLPLRLPCYDFTPITSPTFDGSLPKRG